MRSRGEEKKYPENSKGTFFEPASHDALAWFESHLATYSSDETRANYGKFVASLSRYLAGRRIALADITPELTLDYQQTLLRAGRSYKYVARLGKHFRAMYRDAVRQGLAPERKDAFTWVDSTPEAGREEKPLAGRRDTIELLQRLAALDLADRRLLARTRDQLLFATLMGGLTIDDLLTLRRDALGADGRLRATVDGRTIDLRLSPLADQLLGSIGGDEWLIALGQSLLSPDEAATRWLRLVGILLEMADATSETLNHTLPTRLCERALRELSLNLDVVKAALCHIPPHSSLQSYIARPAATAAVDDALRQLSHAVVDLRLKWYAVRMNVDVDRFRELLPAGVTSYYPIERIAVRIGKRVKEIESPILKRVIFVRLTEESLLDLARTLFPFGFVYRASSDERRYAVIPDREMSRFTQIVTNGHGFELSPDGDAPTDELTPQTRVRISDHVFAGYEGVVVESVGHDRYRVQLLDIGFTVDCTLPKVFLTKV